MKVARILPRSLKEPLRIVLNAATYSFGVHALGRDPLLPTRWLHTVGPRNFVPVGDEFAGYFVELCGLRAEHRVLDIGCGTGRMARPLTRHLTTGSYDGIDIVKTSINWCRRAYSAYPNFTFHFSDLRNSTYNPTGKLEPATYEFPFASASFDFIFLASVFTHMMPAGVQRYLEEIARVIKPGGSVLATYFLLNNDSLKATSTGKSSFTFPYQIDEAYITNIDDPEMAVAYNEETITDWYARVGLHTSIKYGKWPGRTGGFSFQDIVIAKRPA